MESSAPREIAGRCERLGSLSIVEVSDASALAGDLFFGAFQSKVPNFPRHFLLIKKTVADAPLVMGYVHYTKDGDAYLAGGLVVAALEFRRLDSTTARLVKEKGGLAEWLMTVTCGWLSDAAGIFAYMGDAKSITVNTRVGFRPTGHKYLYVIWRASVSDAERVRLLERIAEVGPF